MNSRQLSMEGVGVVSPEGRTILRDVSLTVGPSDFVAVTGPNGGGKTTLLRVMLGLLAPAQGRVTNTFASIGYLPQKTSVDARFPITIAGVVEQGLLGLGLSRGERRRRALEALRRTGMEERADSPIAGLSGGQLQRTLLARAIAPEPTLLVLDEPLSYLDKEHERAVHALLAELRDSMAIVLVSHEMTGFAPMATQHVIVDVTLTRCHSSRHGVRYEC